MESVIDEQAYAHAPVWNMAFSFINSMSLKCALELGIVDAIQSHGKPIPLSLLLSKLSIPPARVGCFRRIMRLLIHSGFLARQTLAIESTPEEEMYSLTAVSRALFMKEKTNQCISAFVLGMLSPEMLMPSLHLAAWLTTVDDDRTTAFELVHGEPFYKFTQKHTEFSSMFNEAMASDSRFVAQLIIREHSDIFSRLSRLVDVGGGSGSMALMISNAFPGLKCVVLDLPHVVASVQEQTSMKNVEFVGGNMLEHIPIADAVVLKWVLSDWDDKDCVRILQNCKEAIPSKEHGGKVIIIENVMDMDNSSCMAEVAVAHLLFDICVQSITPGKQRSGAEWEKIFTAAGFEDYKITPIMDVRSVIELYY